MTLWYCWSLIPSCFTFIPTVPVRMAPVLLLRLRAGKELIELSAVGAFYLYFICAFVCVWACVSLVSQRNALMGRDRVSLFLSWQIKGRVPHSVFPLHVLAVTRIFGGVRHAWVKYHKSGNISSHRSSQINRCTCIVSFHNVKHLPFNQDVWNGIDQYGFFNKHC